MHAMGSIRELSSGQTQLLQPEHLVGRASTCALRLSHRWVSAQHALLRWAGGRWEVKDLGSRNGTFLDGSRLKPGDEYVVRRGAKLAFGKVSEGQWEVADTSPPPAMAVPLDGGEPVQIDGDFIVLPSNDDPRVTIYRNQEGVWVLEHSDESSAPILNLQTFEVSGRGWRFCCAEESRTTALGPSPADLEVCHLSLAFSVSRDEEHVELQASSRGITFDLGARAHNYLLLTLARRRLKDAEEGLPHVTCGWIDQEELAHDPSMAPPQLNIDVFRIRKQFAALGVMDAANIVERRPRTRQLRIGTGLLLVTQI
jgi:pSer/pThr/pTyr-binding forkhead associated (FHA) protein